MPARPKLTQHLTAGAGQRRDPIRRALFGPTRLRVMGRVGHGAFCQQPTGQIVDCRFGIGGAQVKTQEERFRFCNQWDLFPLISDNATTLHKR